MVSVIKTSNSPQVVDASQQPLLLVLWRSFSTVLFDVPMTEVMQFLVPSYTVTLVQPLPSDTETGLTQKDVSLCLAFRTAVPLAAQGARCCSCSASPYA